MEYEALALTHTLRDRKKSLLLRNLYVYIRLSVNAWSNHLNRQEHHVGARQGGRHEVIGRHLCTSNYNFTIPHQIPIW